MAKQKAIALNRDRFFAENFIYLGAAFLDFLLQWKKFSRREEMVRAIRSPGKVKGSRLKKSHEYQSKDPKASQRWSFEKPLKFPVVRISSQQRIEDSAALIVLPQKANPDRKSSIVVPSSIAGDARELRFCQQHSKVIGGICEFSTPDGRIDILTEEAVIEAKMGHNWKHGIGQLLVYSFYFPDRIPTLILLDDVDGTYKKMAHPHCDRLGITILSMEAM